MYALHDYVPAGLGRADDYDPQAAEEKFLQRSAYARRTGTPIYVGEFAPIYSGDERIDALRRRILDDQLERYRRHDAGYATWMYKDLGRQGLTYVRPDSLRGNAPPTKSLYVFLTGSRLMPAPGAGKAGASAL